MPSSDPLVALAVVVRPHGNHGELRVKLHNPGSDLLFHVETLVLRSKRGEREARVTSVRPHQKGIALLHLQGCVSRDQAEALRSAELCVPRSALPDLAEDEYYLYDLVGLKAVRPDGSEVGEVEAVQVYPTLDALRIRAAQGVCELPLLEPYLVRVEIPAGRIVVDALQDLDWKRPRNPSRKSR